ncbi:MAG: fumarate reductase subunit D [Gemmatimonadetes bacterium]|uniref:Fumarate reductase subunit D n=1 Tax=marine metagenome TaxID=408172 RepID=A0A382FBY5_9ZZZZ|nr:fumarate reductase subunit D [Gemmatimonadota bacterium]
MKKSNDAFWWTLFGGGGALTAMFVPALLFLFTIATPLGWVEGPSYANIAWLLMHPLTRIVAFGLISLSFFHWAHRFRFTLYDGLQLKHLFELIAVICYGGAIAGSLVAAYVLL